MGRERRRLLFFYGSLRGCSCSSDRMQRWGIQRIHTRIGTRLDQDHHHSGIHFCGYSIRNNNEVDEAAFREIAED